MRERKSACACHAYLSISHGEGRRRLGGTNPGGPSTTTAIQGQRKRELREQNEFGHGNTSAMHDRRRVSGDSGQLRYWFVSLPTSLGEHEELEAMREGLNITFIITLVMISGLGEIVKRNGSIFFKRFPRGREAQEERSGAWGWQNSN
jgi:hypothetical protein